MFRPFFQRHEMAAKGNIGNARSPREMWALGTQRPSILRKLPDNRPSSVSQLQKRTEEECSDVLEALQKTYICLECKVHYKGCDNLGQWQCSAHRGRFSLETGWKCCGGGRTAKGCTRADHVSSPEMLQAEDVHLEMPLWILLRFSVPTERVTIVPHENPFLTKAIIHRVEDSMY